MKKFAVLMTLFLFLSCEKEPTSLIEAELAPYFQRFVDEAKLREKAIDMRTNSLTASIVINLPSGVAGQCSFNTQRLDEVKISRSYWSGVSDLDREYVVFHELGHCILGLSHDDEKNVNGVCRSIMQSGTGKCRKSYTPANRKEFIDELFDR
jgi:hypothetical protein